MKALSFDGNIPFSCKGVVHSVFDSALNIIGSDRLISVVNKKYFNGPNRIVVGDFFDFKKNSLGDNSVAIKNSNIVFSGGLKIDFENSYAWSAVVGIKKINVAKIDTTIVSGYLDNYSFIRPEIANKFKTSLILSDSKLLDSAVNELVGLGFGLTPSGDDFLGGALSASRFFNRFPQFDFFMKNIKIDYSKTNFISAEYLRYAFEGRISEVIANTVISVSENKSSADFWLTNLVNTGATSGKDTLLGILTAMEVYNACQSC